MRDIRYKIELEKLKKENLFPQILDKTEEKNINLYTYRHQLKELILHEVNNKVIVKLIESPDEMKLLKEYRSFVLYTKNLYPRFIFDEFDLDKFEKCVNLKKLGCTLVQIEEYYVNVLCADSKSRYRKSKIISK